MKKKVGSAAAWTEIETASYMKELAEDLKRKAAKHGVEAELALDASLPGRLRLDATFLKESFFSLFSHSAEASGKEKRVFFVRGDNLEAGSFALRVSVSEDGEGFGEEELELLEEKKDICPNPYLSKLFAIRKEAKEGGGDFFIYSTPGSGAVYYMLLPCEILTSITIGELEKEKEAEGLHNTEQGKKQEEQPLEHGWIDRKLALNYAGNIEEMRLELLGIYYEQAQQYLKELPIIFEEEDWEKYRITVHAIKGNSLGIGAESFSKEAYEQEMAAKNGDVKKIKAEFQNFYSHYRSLAEEVKNSKL